jgi:hypothetical protein
VIKVNIFDPASFDRIPPTIPVVSIINPTITNAKKIKPMTGIKGRRKKLKGKGINTNIV